jgi:hypothetical protein
MIDLDIPHRVCVYRELDRIALACCTYPLSAFESNASQEILKLISFVISLIEDQINSKQYMDVEVDKLLDIKHNLCISTDLSRS